MTLILSSRPWSNSLRKRSHSVPIALSAILAAAAVGAGCSGKSTTSDLDHEGAGAATSSGGSQGSGAGTGAGGGTGATAAGGSATTTGGTATTGGTGTTTLVPPTDACPNLTVEPGVAVGEFDTTRFSFGDLDCLPRTASMSTDTRGFLRQFTYEYDGNTRTATGTGVNGWDGFGFIVNHGGFGGSTPSEPKIVFQGDHHAIWEYHDDKGGVSITRQWFFASGRSSPVIAINYDASAASPGLGWDTRTPYGDIAWDGDEICAPGACNTVVSGIGWGDRYKFVTTTAPLTLNSAWDYAEANTIPYCFEWADLTDAEMGLVQTQTFTQHDGGGYWEYDDWGKTSATQNRDDQQVAEMPQAWNWTYQLNQYELCYEQGDACVDSPTNSHRISWGTNYGAVGGNDGTTEYPAYGDDKMLSGYPYQSYSVYMVLGKHTTQSVYEQVHETEAAQATTLTASVGSVVTELPGGVGRTDNVTLAPAGYDHRYGTWNVVADGNKVTFTAAVSAGVLRNPVLVVRNYTAAEPPASVSVGGVAGTVNIDYLPSVDTAGQMLWLTLRPGWEGTKEITIE